MSYLPILTYHRVLPGYADHRSDPNRISLSQERFRTHLAWLDRLGYRTIGLDEYSRLLRQGGTIPSRSVAITFDDGYEDVLTYALPVLRDFHFTATVFAVTGQLGGFNTWDDGGARLLTAHGLRALTHAGITIGAHSSHHVHLTRVDVAVAQREIEESKQHLEQVLGRPVSLFAYPYGESNEQVERFVEQAGFTAAFATDRAPRDHAQNRFRLRRVVIFPQTNLWQLLWKVQRWYPLYQDWQKVPMHL
jgi:peptidoglycan/xylan/chitin deacetylase (PgdA/CDA1 family)